jgi:hypothetical protein
VFAESGSGCEGVGSGSPFFIFFLGGQKKHEGGSNISGAGAVCVSGTLASYSLFTLWIIALLLSLSIT